LERGSFEPPAAHITGHPLASAGHPPSLVYMGEEKLGVLVFGTNFGVTTHVRALRDAGFTVLGLR
jgi:hypothetical protein